MKTLLLVISCIALLFANDAGYERGEMLYFKKGCNNCHGSEAEGGGVYPRLANKPLNYLRKRIYHFKNDKLKTVSEDMMAQFVRSLSPQEVEDLIYFLSTNHESGSENIDDELLGGYGS